MLKLNTKGFITILSISGLILLLLLSPCSVRNSIQSLAGVPQTNVSNVSKAAISAIGCAAYESSSIQSKPSQNLQKINSFTAFFAANLGLAEVDNKVQLLQDKSWLHHFSIVPSYILHQNFRAFL